MPNWTEEEIQTLKEMWETPEISVEEMAKVLTARNRDSIRKKAASIDLCPMNERMKPEIDTEYYKKLMEVVKG